MISVECCNSLALVLRCRGTPTQLWVTLRGASSAEKPDFEKQVPISSTAVSTVDISRGEKIFIYQYIKQCFFCLPSFGYLDIWKVLQNPPFHCLWLGFDRVSIVLRDNKQQIFFLKSNKGYIHEEKKSYWCPMLETGEGTSSVCILKKHNNVYEYILKRCIYAFQPVFANQEKSKAKESNERKNRIIKVGKPSVFLWHDTYVYLCTKLLISHILIAIYR